jgi:3-deoxy-7-phosphoheptulonate synthase
VRVSPAGDAASTAARADDVERALRALGLWTRRHVSDSGAIAFAISPSSTRVPAAELAAIPHVAELFGLESPHPLLDAMARTVTLAPGTSRAAVLGGAAPKALLAGPCSVESEAQIHRLAHAVKAAGATVLRGGVWKPRTSPRGFQGLGAPALRWLTDAAHAAGLAVVTEVTSERDVEAAAALVDALQVGARTMHASALLREVGRTGRPVLLKRAFSASLEEWLLAAEALLLAGAPAVLLCERGVRGPDGGARNVLDVGAIAVCAAAHGLPVLVDPSHAAGRRDIVCALAAAGLAAGACGAVVEVHDRPGEAQSDAPQALDPAVLQAWWLERNLR